MSEDSPNKEIDKAIKQLLKDVSEQPIDVRCKAINTAINWEKLKNNVRDGKDDFDPDSL